MNLLRGETLLIKDVAEVEVASAVFEYIDQVGKAMLVCAVRTSVDNLQAIDRQFNKPILGKDGELLSCSFCGKSQNDVQKLIAGPGVYICNECIDICDQIIADPDAGKASAPVKKRTTRTHKTRPTQEISGE